MTEPFATQIASALRPIAPEGKLDTADVPHIDAIAANWARRDAGSPAQPQGAGEWLGGAAHSLRDAEGFFRGVRAVTGPLAEDQVATINGLLSKASHWSIAWLAYGLATAWHEARMRPIEEIGKGRGRRYGVAGARSDGKPGPNYGGQVPYGRGLVQLTWADNYEKADRELDLKGTLLANFGLALDPNVAAAILVRGMEEGWFTAKKLADYLPAALGNEAQFVQARRIINGTDRAQLITSYARKFQDALVAGGWA